MSQRWCIRGRTLGAPCQKNHTTVSPGLVYRDAGLIKGKSNPPTANFGALRTYQIGAQTVMCDTYSATSKGIPAEPRSGTLVRSEQKSLMKQQLSI